MAKPIQAILADMDGTLIEGGKLENHPLELKPAVQAVRSRGVLFNLASGRPYFEQEQLYRMLVDSDQPRDKEGILYEGSRIRLFGEPKPHVLGGLDQDRIRRIQEFLTKQGLVEGLVPEAGNENYESQTCYVTPTFLSEGRTDQALLEQRFSVIKPSVESVFSKVEVSKSADAIDIFARGLNKSRLAVEYSRLTGIPLSNIATIGDSGNDLSMFEVVGKAGGLVVYVGTDRDQENMVRGYSQHFVPEQHGPLGTVEALYYLLYI